MCTLRIQLGKLFVLLVPMVSRKDTPVLKGINLTVPVGKTTALVGASGCGKSSIIQLVQRFYDPSSGSILLDGVDIKKYPVKWLRQQVNFPNILHRNSPF